MIKHLGFTADEIKYIGDKKVSDGFFQIFEAGNRRITMVEYADVSNAYGCYTGKAEDEDGNEFVVTFEVNDWEEYEDGDGDCCDWEHPVRIDGYVEITSEEAAVYDFFKYIDNAFQDCKTFEHATMCKNCEHCDLHNCAVWTMWEWADVERLVDQWQRYNKFEREMRRK